MTGMTPYRQAAMQKGVQQAVESRSEALLGRVLSAVPSYYDGGLPPRAIARAIEDWHGSSIRHALMELMNRGLLIREGKRGSFLYRRALKDLL